MKDAARPHGRAALHGRPRLPEPAAQTPPRKVKGTIHWVSAARAIDAEVRLYDRLFTAAEPEAGGDFRKALNPRSLEVVTAKLEPSLRGASRRNATSSSAWATSRSIRSTRGRAGPYSTGRSPCKDTWAKAAPAGRGEAGCMSETPRCPGVRANGITSRMFETPVTNISIRSNPRPKPACGTVPHRRRSRYQP